MRVRTSTVVRSIEKTQGNKKLKVEYIPEAAPLAFKGIVAVETTVQEVCRINCCAPVVGLTCKSVIL